MPSIALGALPKVELHVHLEGSMSPATIGSLAARHSVDTTTIWPGGLPQQFSFDGFVDFARQFLFGLQLLRSGEDLITAIVALGADLAANNVRYAEVTSTVFSHLRAGMRAADYGHALTVGRARVEAEHGVSLGWVIDIPRDLEMPDSNVTIEFLESVDVPDGVVAVGLGGYEVGFPPEPYQAQFARAKALGLKSVPHAGETDGAASVRGALDVLGADRVGHGVRCLDDHELVARLRDEGVMLEVCPTSNVLLHVAASHDSHPLGELREAGLRVCINTDDPGMFATDLNTELAIAQRYHGLDLAQLRDMQLDALAASYAPAGVRRSITEELTTITLD